MAALDIVKGQDAPILRRKAKKVDSVTKKVLKLLRDMEDTMQGADGLGLAAPQVGESSRICIARIGDRITYLINPEITERSSEKAISEEGCLSLPGLDISVPRSVQITVRYLDEKGKTQERKLRDLDARVVQHEVDHLDGILIVDYLLPEIKTISKEKFHDSKMQHA